MTEFAGTLVGALRMPGMLELVAVGLAIAYLILAIRQHPACWWCAIGSAALYVRLMYAAGLYMESALQFFYIGMAVYGWWSWRARPEQPSGRLVTDWPPALYLLPLLVIAGLTVVSSWLLLRYTEAAYPVADSFTTWGAIVATWLVARKVLQNWHYWFVIDAISVYLYWQRELFLTAFLFVGYLVLIVVGWRAWRRSLPVRLAV